MTGDALGDRMKGYESAARTVLPRRLPMIVRADGRAFHSFTRGFDKPWDSWMVGAMQEVASALCEDVAGCRLAYVQSDEISLLVRDDMELGTQPWFGKQVQKVASIVAGVASAKMTELWITTGKGTLRQRPSFDARCFVLPPAEVCNYFVWRQQDAVRNSIQVLGQAHFSQRELHGKSCDEIQEMLWRQKGINWNDTPTHLKRGSCVRRVEHEVEPIGQLRTFWEIDIEIPTFTQDRSYVERLLIDETKGEEP